MIFYALVFTFHRTRYQRIPTSNSIPQIQHGKLVRLYAGMMDDRGRYTRQMIRNSLDNHQTLIAFTGLVLMVAAAVLTVAIENDSQFKF